MAESDRLLSDCTPFKGVPRVQIPLSPPVSIRKILFYPKSSLTLAFNLAYDGSLRTGGDARRRRSGYSNRSGSLSLYFPTGLTKSG